MRLRQTALVSGFIVSLLFVGQLRNAGFEQSFLTPYSGYATPAYVMVTVLFLVLLSRSGVEFNRVGFGFGLKLRHVVLAVIAVACLQLGAAFVEPLLEKAFGGGRDLQRFADVAGSVEALAAMLLLNWVVAAFGEEIAFRIVLMRGIASALGDTRVARGVALVLQAVVFGLVHQYQGSTGIASSALSGLILGAVTLAARGAIWPAALAHGSNNTIGLITLFRGG